MTQSNSFIQTLENRLKQISFHKHISSICDVDSTTIKSHDDVITILNNILTVGPLIGGSNNYLCHFLRIIDNLLSHFPYHTYENIDFINEKNKSSIKKNIELQNDNILKQINVLEFNYSFFKKLGFFKHNIVVVGANGSGKTTLSNELKKYLPKSGVVISAQKFLLIPTFDSIANLAKTQGELESIQSVDKTLKTTYFTGQSGSAYQILHKVGCEFEVLLSNMLAERNSERNIFCNEYSNSTKKLEVPFTKLDKVISIWNSLIQHRILECKDGINIALSFNKVEPYPAFQMSDGEKAVLYYTMQILLAPDSGFIIIDEPEMYLHKAILTKLWDVLENERPDCIFIYLTHDLDFATTRFAKKLWIKAFNYPNDWEIEDISNNELPEELLLELLGSRKNILFCEGTKGSIDYRIYNILFPNFTITPVGSCLSVINYTRAFNKITNNMVDAFGLIDSDHNSEERKISLRKENIFSISMAEPENLFFDKEFLEALSMQLLKNGSIIESIISDVLSLFECELELQVSNYISSKINYHFENSHVLKGNSLKDIQNNYRMFTDKIKIQNWFDTRKAELIDIIKAKDYSRTLAVFNNKGLKSIANKHYQISDFIEFSINLLKHNKDTHKYLKKYFPKEITK